MNQPRPREFLEIQAPDKRWWLPFPLKSDYLRQARGLWREITTLRREIMAGTDRELAAAILAGLNALGPAIDALSTDRDGWKDRALSAEGREAADEAEDVAAVQPVKDLVDALVSKMAPAAPDVAEQPSASPEEATEVVNAAPDPSPSDDGPSVA